MKMYLAGEAVFKHAQIIKKEEVVEKPVEKRRKTTKADGSPDYAVVTNRQVEVSRPTSSTVYKKQPKYVKEVFVMSPPKSTSRVR